jgi:hypothetical protein
MGISLIFAYLVYLLAKRIGGERIGLIALALSIFCPSYFTMRLIHASGEYLLVMVFGVVTLLLCDDILFARQLNTAEGMVLREHVSYGLLGLAMGIGLWVFPLIISFIGAGWVILFLRDRICFFRTTFLVFLLCFVVGGVPAILFNTLPELRAAGGMPGAPNWISYTSLFVGSPEPLWSRIVEIPETLFQVAKVSLPILVGGSLWEYETSLWRRSIAVILVSFWLFAVLYTIGARVRLWLRQQGRRRWELAHIDIVLLQFLLALVVFATSKYRGLFREPRYLTPVFVFLPIAGACFLNRLYSNKKVLSYSVLIVVLALNMNSSIWFSESLDPDHGLWPKDEELIQYLIDNQIRHPIANYWIAHSITFESNEQVISVPIGYYRFNVYKDVLDKFVPTHFIFRKRERDDRYFNFFSYGLAGTQWTAYEFADLLYNMGVPGEAYRAYEFDHYVLYDVPHQYLDPAVILSPYPSLPEAYVAEASGYLVSAVRPGDGLLLNPPELVVPLGRQGTGGAEVYLVPDQVPLDEAITRDDLTRIISDHRRLFVLFGDTSASDPERFVESWLNGYAYPADDRWLGELRLVFYGTTALSPAEQPTQMWNVLFGARIELLGTDLIIKRFDPGDVVPLTLFWQAREPVGENFKVFVHLLNASGQLTAQRDSEPVGGLRPTSTWGVGELVIDRYGVLLPDDLPAGEYQLIVGLYDPVTGNRLPVTAHAGAPPDDFLLVGAVYVGP